MNDYKRMKLIIEKSDDNTYFLIHENNKFLHVCVGADNSLEIRVMNEYEKMKMIIEKSGDDIIFMVHGDKVFAHHRYLEDDMPVNSDEEFEDMLNAIMWKIVAMS